MAKRKYPRKLHTGDVVEFIRGAGEWFLVVRETENGPDDSISQRTATLRQLTDQRQYNPSGRKLILNYIEGRPMKFLRLVGAMVRVESFHWPHDEIPTS